MGLSANVLILAQNMQKELIELGVSTPQISNNRNTVDIFDKMVTNKMLKKKTEKLFRGGHHARAVEEAYKLLDNAVKNKAGFYQLDLTGAALMQKVFSSNKPILKLNTGITVSERNEQSGYMQIYAGCMTGIRNPRAHESDWEDTEERALQLIILANHLIEKAQHAELSEDII